MMAVCRPTSQFTRVASNSAFLRRERPLAKANELNVLFPNDYVAEINPDPKTHQGGVGLHGLTAGGRWIRTIGPWRHAVGSDMEDVDSRGQFVTFTAEELNAIDVESSKVIDLESLCRGAISIRSISTVHTTLYADCSIAVETLRMIGAAMAEGDLR